jgi:hypothetical protein
VRYPGTKRGTLRLEDIARWASEGGKFNVKDGCKIGKEVIFGLLPAQADSP